MLSLKPLLIVNSYGSRLLSLTLSRPFSNRTVTLIPGDGVWPETFTSVQKVFKDSKIPIEWDELDFNSDTESVGDILKRIENSIKANKICIKGIIKSNAINLGMRRNLDLYANLVMIKSIPGIKTRYQNLDFVIIREQLEGEYSALEHESVPGVVECLKIITSKNSERIARLAFDYAVRHDRKKVTAVHKANIMKLGDGLFLNSCIEVSKLYPTIKFEHMIIDNTCMQLVSKPDQFDVMVMPNLYGNIIDNLGAGLVGGAGLVPGKSFSHKYAVFEPGARHAFSIAAGQNIANPSAILLACSHMLKHINMHEYAERLNNAVLRSLENGKSLTKDVGGSATTSEFADEVIRQMNAA